MEKAEIMEKIRATAEAATSRAEQILDELADLPDLIEDLIEEMT
jgi:hypothetical protein